MSKEKKTKQSNDKALIPKLDKWFGELKDSSHIHTFDNEKFCGIEIKWVLKGVGFGGLMISYDKEKKKWTADRECMNTSLIERILHKATPKLAELYIKLDSYDSLAEKESENE